jgi:uncharacterized damage-inducible protein DinB
VLLEQLRTTHDEEDWFVPASVAVAGLTADQAKWTPGKDAHSVGQLAYHLWFWDTQALARFKGQKPPTFSGNNDETFNNFSPAQWEAAVQEADDQKLADNASLIAHVGAHNAYHIGQILYVRKLEGVWDASKGVK